MRFLTALCLMMLGTSAALAQSIFVRFPDAGPRDVWIQRGLPSEAPENVIKTQQTSVEVPVEGKAPTEAVYVWDRRSGNLASRTLKDVQAAGTWRVEDRDYHDIAEVVVNVTHEGKPVAAANVSLNDTRRVHEQLVTGGEARFFAVRPGSLKVTVRYKTEGKNAKPVTQIFEAAKSREDATPTLTIALPEPTMTLDAAAPEKPGTAPAAEPKAAEPESGPRPVSGVGSFFVYLIALAVAVGVGFLIFRYFKQNPELVGSKLEQLGVQVPKPGDDAGAEPLNAVAPAAPVRPAPPEKIVLDDAAPTPLSGFAMAAAAAVSTGEPTLIAESGDALTIPEGELTVGREVGLGLSLVGETTVSRKHAALVRTGTQVVVRDLGSTNGTYVNGAKVNGEVALRPGDAIQFGSVRFRFEG